MAGSRLIAQGIDRRRAILRFVKDYQSRYRMAPSVVEIAQGLEDGPLSKTAVRHHLQILIDEGIVSMRAGKYRSLQVISDRRY